MLLSNRNASRERAKRITSPRLLCCVKQSFVAKHETRCHGREHHGNEANDLVVHPERHTVQPSHRSTPVSGRAVVKPAAEGEGLTTGRPDTHRSMRWLDGPGPIAERSFKPTTTRKNPRAGAAELAGEVDEPPLLGPGLKPLPQRCALQCSRAADAAHAGETTWRRLATYRQGRWADADATLSLLFQRAEWLSWETLWRLSKRKSQASRVEP